MHNNLCFEEGQQARINAEVNAAIHNTTISCVCVYKRIDKLTQYKNGWNAVSAIDISIAISRAKGELPNAHNLFKQQQNKLKRLVCSG